MSRIRPLEVRALVPLLEQEWESAEELAGALIAALDTARADRTDYIGVMQFRLGDVDGHKFWYAAVGPYPGRKSAQRALEGDPSVSLAHRLAVVPLTSAEGLRRRIARHDS